MNIDNLIRVKFYNDFSSSSSSFIQTPPISNLIEIDIGLDNLLILMFDIEKKHQSRNNGSSLYMNHYKVGSYLHKEAYDGLDSLGNPVHFNSYVCWEHSGNYDKQSGNVTIYKYNFDDYVPLNSYIKMKQRNWLIDSLIK